MTTQETIVLKYGGTSVGTGERLLHVANVVKEITKTSRPIVVLSAMSSSQKRMGTTSRLLEAVEEILTPESQKYLDIVGDIESFHLTHSRTALENHPEILSELEKDIKSECAKLRSFMVAAEMIDEISPKTRDSIVAMGEKLSARIFSRVLEAQGVATKYFNLDKLIDRQIDSKSLDQSFYDYLAERLGSVVGPYVESHVCVLTGFFGPCPGSLLDTIGRGYTDLTAALVAVGTKAKELQIWKEVDGIFTADPRKVVNARKLEKISPEEAAELTYYGSEVIHPFTMEQVIRASIPIRIKNTFKPEGEGTVILPSSEVHGIKKPTAVTIKDNVTVLNIHSNRKSVSHGFFAQTFLILDTYGIVVDLISTSEVHVSMALGHQVREELFQKALRDLQKLGTVTLVNLG
jgi:aspartate kinase